MSQIVNQLVHNLQLEPADAIVAKKRGYRVFDHYIIYLGRNYHGHLFIANSMDKGVRLYNEDEVLQLQGLFEPVKIRRFHGSTWARHEAVNRATSQLGRPYSLLASNCEHLANYIQRGVKDSPQVGGWAFVLLLALGIGIVSSNS